MQGDDNHEDGSCDREEPEIVKVTGSSLPVSPTLGDRDKTSEKVIEIACFIHLWMDFDWWWGHYFQVLDAVRAAEMLVSNMVPKSPGPNRVDMKTTTIVMSKHTLAPQTSTVSGLGICWPYFHSAAGSSLSCRSLMLTFTWSIDFQSALSNLLNSTACLFFLFRLSPKDRPISINPFRECCPDTYRRSLYGMYLCYLSTRFSYRKGNEIICLSLVVARAHESYATPEDLLF